MLDIILTALIGFAILCVVVIASLNDLEKRFQEDKENEVNIY